MIKELKAANLKILADKQAARNATNVQVMIRLHKQMASTKKIEDRPMTPVQHKTYEDRLRRMAQRQGLTLYKSRRRDPLARDFGRYMLADERNVIVAGATQNAYEMSIDEIERYLTDPNRPGWRKGRMVNCAGTWGTNHEQAQY